MRSAHLYPPLRDGPEPTSSYSSYRRETNARHRSDPDPEWFLETRTRVTTQLSRARIPPGQSRNAGTPERSSLFTLLTRLSCEATNLGRARFGSQQILVRTRTFADLLVCNEKIDCLMPGLINAVFVN